MNPVYLAYESFHAAVLGPRIAVSAARQSLDVAGGRVCALPQVRAISAGLEMFERLTRRYAKPRFNITSTTFDGQSVEVSERVQWSRPFCNLIRFERSLPAGTGEQPRLLIVAPMSGHHATLVRGTVKAFLPTHDVYVTDWADASNVPVSAGSFGLDDYIDYVREMMSMLSPELHVMAICQPAVPTLAAVALMEQDRDPGVPVSMTLIGGPIDTRVSPTRVNALAVEKGIDWFRTNCIAEVPWNHEGAGRRVYPGILQLNAFMSMNAERHMSAHAELFNNLATGSDADAQKQKDFYDEYLAIADLTEEFYLETVERVFVRHDMPLGRFEHRGRTVDPSAIRRVALMTIEGEDDDITGLGQTKAAHSLCTKLPPSMKVHYVQEGVGHYGLFSGSKFRNEIVPRVLAFMQD